MNIKELIQVAQSDAVFAVLFTGLLYFMLVFGKNFIKEQREIENMREEQLIELYREQKTESAAREKELMNHLDRLTAQQAEITEALKELKEDMQGGIEKLEDKVDRGFMEVWRTIRNGGEK